MLKIKITALVACFALLMGTLSASHSAVSEQKAKTTQTINTSKKPSKQQQTKNKSEKTKKTLKAAKQKKQVKSSAKKLRKSKQAPISKDLNALRFPVKNANLPSGIELSPRLPKLAPGSEQSNPLVGPKESYAATSGLNIDPIKQNGAWVGSINGKQIYKMGEAVYVDLEAQPIYVKQKSTYPTLPPLPVIEQP